MLKKALPLLVLSGVLLVGCTNKEAIPKNDETPMEKVREDARDLKDNVEEDVEGRDINDGTINDPNDNIDGNRKENKNHNPEIDENGNVD